MNTSGSAHTLIIVSAPSPTPGQSRTQPCTHLQFTRHKAKVERRCRLSWTGTLEEVKTERSAWVKELAMASPQTMLFGTEVQTEQVRALVEYQQWICPALDVHQSKSTSETSKIQHSRRAWQRSQRVRGHGVMARGSGAHANKHVDIVVAQW
ncbi:hypothetical protein ARMGADRAFT_575868 [Armillaria gallica]|uniref:Uncharacterized protein n=1 Tax=Armillaria gallica TaxID=47427 RepID=A0A2H3DX25_ARMGA|nr:hypothetical protein ARMGADRAFT_575868 [Armillaria gallica]